MQTTTETSTSHARGMAIFDAILPDMPDRLETMLNPVAPDMVRFIIDVAGGDVLADTALSLREREAATIATLAALGNAAPQLAVHVRGGLASGLSPQEIVDILYLTAVFAGFPAALNAITVAAEIFRETAPSWTPSAEPATRDQRHARGLAALDATSGTAGTAVLDAVRALSPRLCDLLTDFSYGDIISRTHLAPELKELCMLASAAARSMLPQFKVHVQAALQVGVSRQAIIALCEQMAVYAGFPAALNVLFAAGEVLDASKA